MHNRLGLIVNPIAGMGGKLGLKGTDGEEVLAKCRSAGAFPEAPSRVVQALRVLAPLKEIIRVLTYPGEMGADEASEAGFHPAVLGSINPGKTTSLDTRKAAQTLAEAGVDLILFGGGDGTARDIYESVGESVVVLGVPTGVKMHSAVFAINPRRAGELAGLFMTGKVTRVREAEVMDIDEDAFRKGSVSAQLYGYLRVPHQEMLIQSMKAGRRDSEEESLKSISYYVLDQMQKDLLYVIGPGTTTQALKSKFGQGGTLLGVDAVANGEFIGNDLNEAQLLEFVTGRPSRIIVTVIGGQGYIFGRGNQQISPRVIRAVGTENIVVIATRGKMIGLWDRPLLVDTGDEDLDRQFHGYLRVVSGYQEQILMRVSS